MSDFEICSSFKNCANRIEQIEIIHELSLKSNKYIFNLLVKEGIIKETDADYQELAELYNKEEVEKASRKAKSLPLEESKSRKARIKYSDSAVETKAVTMDYIKPTREVKTGPKTKAKVAIAENGQKNVKNKLEVKEVKANISPELANIIQSEQSGLSVESIVTYAIFQRKSGVGIDQIARDLGITRDTAYQICAENDTYTGIEFSKTSIGQISDSLNRLSNYLYYIESYVKTGNTDEILKVIEEQREIISRIQAILKGKI